MEHSAFKDNNPGNQLGITLLFCMTGFILFMILSYMIAALCFGISLQNLSDTNNPQNINALKLIQLIVSTGIFIVVPLILAYIFSGNAFKYLNINVKPSIKGSGIVLLIMISAIPAINLIADLNSQLKLPGFMSGIEKFMIDSEKSNDSLTEAFLNVHSLAGFAVNILIVALIPAIGEEFFFRGILQRLLTNLSKNKHWGIILSGFIFSAIHMQFYGFFPRWLLGIMFGYMFVWSGSLWLPIIAHFVNNSLDVTIYYLVNQKLLNPQILDFGFTKDSHQITLLITLITTLIMASGLNWLFKHRISLYSDNQITD